MNACDVQLRQNIKNKIAIRLLTGMHYKLCRTTSFSLFILGNGRVDASVFLLDPPNDKLAILSGYGGFYPGVFGTVYRLAVFQPDERFGFLG